MIVAPPVRYTRSAGLAIAHQVIGAGEVDVVLVPGLLDHMDTVWEQPGLVRFVQALVRFGRVVLLDRRGTGLSDRIAGSDFPTPAQQSDDVLAVMDAVGSTRAVVVGTADGGGAAITFAATHPDRTRALVLQSATACGRRRPGHPWGVDAEAAAALVAMVEQEWGTGALARLFQESSEDVREAFGRMERRSCTPRAAMALARAGLEADVRELLPAVTVPTIALTNPRHPFVPVEAVRDLVARIPGARLVEVDRPFSALEEVCTRRGLAEAIEELVTGNVAVADDRCVLTALLFTDIVDSTAHAARLGDRRWHDLLEEHDRRVRATVERAHGRVVKTTGDGVLARFDGVGRAVRCAQAIVAEGRRIGLAVRAGVHAGDCEERGDDLVGLTVHIGARVADLAGAGEVLVTAAVRDLALGDDLRFEERGRHVLRGVPGEWTLLATR